MTTILEVRDLIKNFGPTKALSNAKLKIYKGHVMGLIGENGAGKSTMINCITGILKPDSGKIIVNKKESKFKSIKDSEKNGIAVVHQELQLVESLSVVENIFLGRLETKYGFVNYKKLIQKTKKLINILGSNIKPLQKISELTIAQQQMVEIAKALSLNAKIIILDEPTDAISNEETKALFNVIKKLREEGISFLYVTHRMKELHQITDSVTIFKDGSFVKEVETKKTKIDELISYMIGRDLQERFPKATFDIRKNKTKYKISNFSNKHVFDINIDLKQGEIFALVGLIGAGRTEFVKSIVSDIKKTSGKLFKLDKELKIKNIKHAIKEKIFYVSENRKLDGLDVNASIKDNIMISSYEKVKNKYTKLISYKKIKKIVEEMKQKTKIKMYSINDLVSSLSGGNQQKVLFSKALVTKPDLLILDEPTRGVDVGARKEIYKIIRDITKQGTTIIMISSELPEAIGMADRIGVFFEGKLSGILNKKDFSEENIMKLATKLGGKGE